ncbi:ion channel [Nonlabens dokdonensis]|uniref:Ion channel n=2 Tax=Nonlabens dokdonensis TaxID=328515 RepID=A0ABX5PZU6_9FLAO|nr:ion channel [Nonlabens dokdonensis]PZX43305.1 ion channel [Nonlabens dokdonensis]
MNKTFQVAQNYKYEILLVALLAHLYIGVILIDMSFYTKVIWPLNMLILGVASIGVFMEKGRVRNTIKNILLILVILLPISIPFLGTAPYFMPVLSLVYTVFFGYIFIEILRFLIKPSYINTDILSASACGFFLIIEVAVFLLQAVFYMDTSSIKGLTTGAPALVYMDLVYFSSITVTSIGFGDITPIAHTTKLLVSVLGVFSQFYSVVLIGILISKFVSKEDQK